MVVLSVPDKANWAPRKSCIEIGEPTESKAHVTSPRWMVAELEKLVSRWTSVEEFLVRLPGIPLEFQGICECRG